MRGYKIVNQILNELSAELLRRAGQTSGSKLVPKFQSYYGTQPGTAAAAKALRQTKKFHAAATMKNPAVYNTPRNNEGFWSGSSMYR